MEKVTFGIGFATGRDNVCNIINSYYKDMLEQVSRFNKEVKLQIYILFDTSYRGTSREDFYKIKNEVKNFINIKYITPEDIEEERINLIENCGITSEEAELFAGYGHAKCRNTVMHFALKDKVDYLLFWDDDEYPFAVTKDENGKLTWIKQDNLLTHLVNIEDADITIGHHCGYISPIPYIDYKKNNCEVELSEYISAVSNDIISWENIKERFELDNGVTYANKEIIENEVVTDIEEENGGKWVAGSTLCINLRHVDKIPAFFNPVGARGEDTFFSTKLLKSRVLRVPTYHFHDGFLKYTSIMDNEFPTELRKIKQDEEDEDVLKRFLKASIGWIKYKPLYMYITDKQNYEINENQIEKNLKLSIPKMNKIFNINKFDKVLNEFYVYSRNVKDDYKYFKRVNGIWNKIKDSICE